MIYVLALIVAAFSGVLMYFAGAFPLWIGIMLITLVVYLLENFR